MRTRLKTMTGTMAALAALALGGSAIATAAQGTAGTGKKAAVERTTGPDTDTIQSGDQTSPDAASVKKATSASVSEPATETSSENPESSAPSDGPGGHEDPAGVDSQTQE
ncbi:MAG: hypothetical protein JWM60_1205 [Solirubrobacterales bacterium]|nr:hypothetical protein [Solirubrobacterales bacterium]